MNFFKKNWLNFLIVFRIGELKSVRHKVKAGYDLEMRLANKIRGYTKERDKLNSLL